MKPIQSIIGNNIKRLSLIQLIRLLNFEHDTIHTVIKRMSIHPNLTLACTKSDFESIEFLDDSYVITSNFLCLYGTSSMLPTFYTEELIFQEQLGNSTLTSFYNIFNRRAYQLLIEILLKNRLMLSLLELRDSEASNFMYSFIGLNRINISKVKHLKFFKLLRYINILNSQDKSVNSLEVFLSDLFNISFKVREMLKVKTSINPKQLNRLGQKNSRIGQVYLGDKIKTVSTSFVLVLQDLTYTLFNEILPGEKKFFMLQEAIRVFFENDQYSYILEYSLKKSEYNKPRSFQLGRRFYSRLGMSSCLGQSSKNFIYNGDGLIVE